MELFSSYAKELYADTTHFPNSIVHSAMTHVMCDFEDNAECTIFNSTAHLFTCEDDVLQTLALFDTIINIAVIKDAGNTEIRNATFLHILRNYASESYYAHVCAYVAVACTYINETYRTRYAIA